MLFLHFSYARTGLTCVDGIVCVFGLLTSFSVFPVPPGVKKVLGKQERTFGIRGAVKNIQMLKFC